ncbi:IS200/IS605 family transposase [Terriglobus roseus]|uniref:REP element-mobilizing transposase RayT n=1 Tax=Terriglobus roseus TaxID=392734 RepID=A0A1H4JH57_9BACT|nr:IS200/IS605 family transposase [Terriglobus roseus]SEB45699.1 REP element-mobilizing transposase RayT [Terriglobus roseus]
MSQSLSRVLVHIVFSTKERRPWLSDAIRLEMHAYLVGTVQADDVLLRVGGVADHVHLAVYLARTEPVARLVERLKVSSSKWIKAKDPEFSNFAWQKGYAVFSVGLRDKAALIEYIDNQATHHVRRDFQAEMRAMFAAYDVDFDERFVWS